MSRDAIIEQLKAHFARSPDRLIAAYLFGSVARGQHRTASDVDVGIVEGRRGPLTLAGVDRVARLADELTRLLGKEVDVVPLDAAPPDFLHRVLVDRVLLLDGDHEQRIEFEIRARNEYFDIAPHLEQYRRTVISRA